MYLKFKNGENNFRIIYTLEGFIWHLKNLKIKLKELIDKETGEIIEVDQITKKVYGQKNFWKLYLSDFLHVLDGIENKRVAILKYILDNTYSSTKWNNYL